MSKKHVNSRAGKQKQPTFLHLDLRLVFTAGLFFVLITAPFMRGLYFQPELLLYQVVVGATFFFCLGDQLLHREETPGLPLLWAAGGLFVAYLLSLTTAVHIRPAIGETLKILSYLLFYYTAYRYVRETSELRRLLIAGYVGALGVAVIGVLAATGLWNFPGAFVNGVINSTLQYKNALAAYLTMFVIIGIALSVPSRTLTGRVAFAAVNTLMVVVILGSQSRAGWILFPAAIAVLIAGLPQAYRWRTAYHALIVVGTGIAAAKGFYSIIGHSPSTSALPCLIAGLLSAAGLQYIYIHIARKLNEPTVPPATRRFAAAAGMVCLALVVGGYILLAGKAYPIISAAFMAPEMAVKSTTITNTEPSFQQRLLYYRDAMKIVGDHFVTGAGGGGWNALYHRYQAFPYWSSEAHSFFFQTWVEAGTMGLAALLGVTAGAVMVFRRLWRRFKQRNQWVYIWAAVTAVIALGLHSIFDFDLSLAALGLLFWALLGGLSALELKSRRSYRSISRDRSQETPPQNSQTQALPSSADKNKTVMPLTAAGVVGLILAAALVWPSTSFYRAGKFADEGRRAIQAQDFDEALNSLLAAHRADPFTAAYAGDIAQIYAVQSLAGDDAARHFQALKWARLAQSREPYNLPLLTALVNLYYYLNEPLKAAATAESMLSANPFLTTSYEVLGRMDIEAALHLLRQGKTEDAEEYLQDIINLPGVIERRRESVAHTRFSAPEPRVTPALNLLAGQAAALRGDHLAALDAFEEIAGNAEVKEESGLWRAAVLELEGNTAAASQILAGLNAQDPETGRRYNEIKDLLDLAKKVH